MSAFRTAFSILALSATALGVALPNPTAAASSDAVCTTGAPITTAGYPISYYAQATPSAGIFEAGYQPEPRWADEHLVGTYTFGVPAPVETGFAYAQFKCQYYCENQSTGGSFFVRGDDAAGSLCHCYNELMDPESFVSDDQSLVGAWNAICKS
ncbi:hypothetical protein F4777DRAFT_174048 [Nemania sp. FL0916]|nr:hypothetical protein F4777DRAFT_174048 [Nemania sp. FL0916]